VIVDEIFLNYFVGSKCKGAVVWSDVLSELFVVAAAWFVAVDDSSNTLFVTSKNVVALKEHTNTFYIATYTRAYSFFFI
jgi:hypothetical protein